MQRLFENAKRTPHVEGAGLQQQSNGRVWTRPPPPCGAGGGEEEVEEEEEAPPTALSKPKGGKKDKKKKSGGGGGGSLFALLGAEEEAVEADVAQPAPAVEVEEEEEDDDDEPPTVSALLGARMPRGWALARRARCAPPPLPLLPWLDPAVRCCLAPAAQAACGGRGGVCEASPQLRQAAGVPGGCWGRGDGAGGYQCQGGRGGHEGRVCGKWRGWGGAASGSEGGAQRRGSGAASCGRVGGG